MAPDTHGESDHTISSVLVRIFSSPEAADLAAANLEARGIQCWLEADDCGGMIAAMDCVRGIKLFVRAEDFEGARTLLDAPPVEAVSPMDAVDAPSSIPPHGGSWFWFMALGVALGVAGCLSYQWASRLGTKTFRYDTNGDRKPDLWIVLSNGYTIEQSYDRNFDGVADYWDHYDSKARRTLTKADENFDGRADFTWSYANGILARGEQDTDFNGTPDVTYFFENDLVSRAEWRPNETNIVTLRHTFRHGSLFKEIRDVNGDGTFDIVVTYDAFQNPIRTNSFNPDDERSR